MADYKTALTPEARQKGRERSRQLREQGLDPSKPRDAARLHPGSLKRAVAAHCWDCCGFQKGEVGRCEITGCFLWPWRPLWGLAGSAREAAAAAQRAARSGLADGR